MVAASNLPEITVRSARQFGQDRIELEIRVKCAAGSELYEINRLNDLLKQGIEDWTNNIAPQLKPLNATTGYSDAITDAWYDVLLVTVNYDKGKRYVKLIAGQWQEYGVTCYPEVFKAAGIPYEKIPDEGFSPLTWKARIVERKDKPPRVLEIQYERDGIEHE